MLQHFDAVYENGVLRPLEPVNLLQHQRVRVSVTTELPNVADVARSQRQFMDELDAALESVPDCSQDDGFTAADHDKLLYGRPA